MVGILGEDTLESMDWCLDQLEHLQTHRSVSDMAADKFKMMLNRELSVLSQGSREGKNISNHITSTYYGRKLIQTIVSLISLDLTNLLAEQQHQHEFDEEDEEPEDAQTIVWKDDSAGSGNSVHTKAVSKIKAAHDLIASKTGELEGFSAELKKVRIWGSVAQQTVSYI